MMHDNFIKDLEAKLNNNHFSPNAISHKDLNTLLKKAKKEILFIENNEINANQEFYDLVTDWIKASEKILLLLNKNEQVFTKNRNSKSLLALGVMGAHINMALQAIKATEFDQ